MKIKDSQQDNQGEPSEHGGGSDTYEKRREDGCTGRDHESKLCQSINVSELKLSVGESCLLHDLCYAQSYWRCHWTDVASLCTGADPETPRLDLSVKSTHFNNPSCI